MGKWKKIPPYRNTIAIRYIQALKILMATELENNIKYNYYLNSPTSPLYFDSKTVFAGWNRQLCGQLSAVQRMHEVPSYKRKGKYTYKLNIYDAAKNKNKY